MSDTIAVTHNGWQCLAADQPEQYVLILNNVLSGAVGFVWSFERGSAVSLLQLTFLLVRTSSVSSIPAAFRKTSIMPYCPRAFLYTGKRTGS